MPSTMWLLIIGIILLIWWLWSQYGVLYSTIRDNPTAVAAGQSVARYATDVQGLINAYEAAQDEQGSFMSRLGAFVGALPR
jgi:hypothetical protein